MDPGGTVLTQEWVRFKYSDGTEETRELIRCEGPVSRTVGMLRERVACRQVYRIAPCNAIHTFFMAFPIDVIFTDRSGTIMKMKQVKPWRTCSCAGADAVYEGVGLLKENIPLEQVEVGY